jgi:hypothetical protein
MGLLLHRLRQQLLYGFLLQNKQFPHTVRLLRRLQKHIDKYN